MYQDNIYTFHVVLQTVEPWSHTQTLGEDIGWFLNNPFSEMITAFRSNTESNFNNRLLSFEEHNIYKHGLQRGVFIYYVRIYIVKTIDFKGHKWCGTPVYMKTPFPQSIHRFSTVQDKGRYYIITMHGVPKDSYFALIL